MKTKERTNNEKATAHMCMLAFTHEREMHTNSSNKKKNKRGKPRETENANEIERKIKRERERKTQNVRSAHVRLIRVIIHNEKKR